MGENKYATYAVGIYAKTLTGPRNTTHPFTLVLLLYLVLRIPMRSVALSLLAVAATGALAQSDTPKPTFTVCAYPFPCDIRAN